MPLTIPSQDEVRTIHHATLRILSDVEVISGDYEARTLLFDHGARESRGRVYLPPDLVETCPRRCPQQVTLCGRAELHTVKYLRGVKSGKADWRGKRSVGGYGAMPDAPQ